ncbi:MAG: nucleoside 2-deoxyribosyltransferase [Candidatus Dormibacteria bacterium]|jgi:nucleoside 2-deoxyribosyltransferase
MSTPSAARLIDAPIAYLAGPEVFLPNAMEIGAEKIAICRAHGIDALFPFEDTQRDGATAADRGHALFLDCVEMMERCNLGIVNMTPFRGVSMDVGTAVELGYMHARGHPVFGYTNVTLDYEARVSDESMAVEAFQFVDNLMCEGPIWRSGGSVVRTHVDPGDLYTDLRGFTRCVEQAATLLGVAPPR